MANMKVLGLNGKDEGWGEYLDDRQPKGFLQCHVGEHPPGSQREAVDVGDVALLVLLRVCHTACENPQR